jgi:chromodomain-helicase-DNA-binding protein 4
VYPGVYVHVQLLEKLLPLLRAGGHRVLVFSQFLGVLNILEDFLSGMSRHLPSFGKQSFCRIDGSTTTANRQRLIAEFNAPDSPYFVMLISTHAGGQGALMLCFAWMCLV